MVTTGIGRDSRFSGDQWVGRDCRFCVNLGTKMAHLRWAFARPRQAWVYLRVWDELSNDLGYLRYFKYFGYLGFVGCLGF